jgi:hypothetical protein
MYLLTLYPASEANLADQRQFRLLLSPKPESLTSTALDLNQTALT